MNFRICIGSTEGAISFGNVIYDKNSIQIESDFQESIVHENALGSIFCLGRAKSKDKSKKITKCFDQISKQSFNSILGELEGRFVLFFITQNSLYTSSDKFGKLDIFYQKNENNITLASNFDLLPESPAKEGFNQDALVHTLTYYGYCPPKKDTLYNSVKRLGVGEYIEIQDGKLTLLKQDFAIPSIQEYDDIKHDDYANIFLGHLKESASNVGNLVYLSSGWDSTSILAGLVHTVGRNKVTGVIGRMKYSERSGCCNQIEIDKAKKFADYYKIKLDVVDFDLTRRDEKFFKSLRMKMRKHQLYAITGFTHNGLASKASELTTKNEIIFAGEISDGAHNLGFSQYATIFHPSLGFREYSDKMASYLFGPTFLSLLMNGKYIDDPVYQLFKSRIGAETIFDEIKGTPGDIKLQLLTSLFLRDARLPFWSLDNNKLLTSQGVKKYTANMQKIYLSDIAKNMDEDNIYGTYLYLYNSFHWQGSTVRSLQTLADYYFLNTDLPFWNSDLQDFLAKMPETWGRGLDLNPTKYPLKKMLMDGGIDYPYDYQDGPHSYTYDINHSFNHSQEIYGFSALVDDFQSSIRDKPYHQILSEDYFDLDYIDSLVDEYINSPKDMNVKDIVELVPIIMLCYVGWYGKEG